MALCKPLQLSQSTLVDAFVFGDIARAYCIRRYYAGHPEDLALRSKYIYVTRMPIGVSLDKRIKMVFVHRAYISGNAVHFSDCWLVRVVMPFPIKHPLGSKRLLVPYRVPGGWVLKLPRQSITEAVFLASNRAVAERMALQLAAGKNALRLARMYLYPVACYKCPPGILAYAEPVRRENFYARSVEEQGAARRP